MRRLLNRRVAAAVAAAAVVAAGAGVVLARRGSSATPQYRTAQATLGTVQQTVTLSGNLAPADETDLNFGSSGRVTAVDVQAGQTVTAGQVLATLDPTTLQAQLAQAQATLESAQQKLSLDQAGPTAQSLQQDQAQVASAQVGLENAQTSLGDTESQNQLTVTQAENTYNSDKANPSTTPQQLAADQAAITAAQAKQKQGNDQAQAQVSTAQVQLQNAQASLAALQQSVTPQQVQMDQSQVQIDQVNVASAQRALDQATLTAPVAGVVGVVNLSVGQSVSGSGGSSSSSGSGGSGGSGGSSGGSGGSGGSSGSSGSGSSSSSSSSPQVSVLTPGAFEVDATASDTQIDELATGQPALVTPAGATQAVTGKVTQIASEATVTSGVATFPVTIALDGSNPSLHGGVSATATVIVNEVVGVLTVPTSAVRGSTVELMVNGKPQTRTVTVGAGDANRTQILSGLNQGDTVVIATVSSSVPSGTRGSGSLTGGGLLGGTGRGARFGG